MARRRKPAQLDLAFRKKRKRAPNPERVGLVPHVPRPAHDANHPVHVTMRAKNGISSLRGQRVFRTIHARIRASAREGFAVTHFSVQGNHIHMICEAADRVALWKGVQRLAQRLAWDVNGVLERAGSLWRDRYHRHDLATPRAVRNALVYVLFNVRKHAKPSEYEDRMESLDVCSSAAWFNGWDSRAGPMLARLKNELAAHRLDECPVQPPSVWLATTGWKRRGLLLPNEKPLSPG
jgi:putative transposase